MKRRRGTGVETLHYVMIAAINKWLCGSGYHYFCNVTDAGKEFVQSWSVYVDPTAIFTL